MAETSGLRTAFEGALKARREIAHLDSLEALLEWDTCTIMPEKGSGGRGAVSGTLASVAHDRHTDPAYLALLHDLTTHAEERRRVLEPWENREVELQCVEVEKAQRLPSSFVSEHAQLVAETYRVWVKAKEDADFEALRPSLERLVEMAREECELRRDARHAHPYDVLLGDYEEGMTVEKYDAFFGALVSGLVPLVQRICDAPGASAEERLKIAMPLDKQDIIVRKLAALMGYDEKAGVMGITEHPFMAKIHQGDVRVALGFDENDLLEGVGSIVHECGHALYSQGHPAAWEGLAIGDSASFGVDESQSRMYENVVARSRQFAETLHLQAVLHAGSHVPGEMTPSRLYTEMNRVQRSLIRVRADEATYNLHIALRYEIEKRLVEGALEVSDLPREWNRLMKAYLGIDVPDDGVGCLQDVHWPSGLFGYFPTYALGNVYGVQLFNAAVRTNPRIPSGLIALREPTPNDGLAQLLSWMREHVHSQGRLYEPETLVRKATGSGPDVEGFLGYLGKKYGELYRL